MKTQARTVYAHTPRPRRHFKARMVQIALAAVALGMLLGAVWN